MTEKKIRGKKEVSEIRPEIKEIFIGNKPFMKYVLSVIMHIKESDSIMIKSRGKFISRAVDVAEVSKKMLKEKHNLPIKEDLKIGSESFENTEGKKINVSTLDITLSKSK